MSQLKEWIHELKDMDLNELQRTLESYSSFGPLPGILMPLLEAFLPILPLLVFVAANANIYGLWFGSLYSWIGVAGGSLLVFLLARKLGGRFGPWLQRRFPKTKVFFNWIEHRGFTPIFLLACFPFSPSAIINVVSGLGKVPFHTFAVAVMLGKAVMIFSVSLLSFDIAHIAQEPWRIIATVVLVVGMWLGGKRIEKRYELKHKE
ncbi:TVP38/TMEM64 family protein [Paenibacillus oenotherae]|uniref:TVP38/TMEM64 family membrane protein n=1 Tax=Paenibacillus oenotherae TaxID=1435645 RepID=A0ABS7D834_9BACL|nr:TVP38/TMEM64 family protein [Paenibacillus oenotherae]MBW7476006.1 TVP38/TMEM64 family protein [Paenibacillus oenotherae]